MVDFKITLNIYIYILGLQRTEECLGASGVAREGGDSIQGQARPVGCRGPPPERNASKKDDKKYGEGDETPRGGWGLHGMQMISLATLSCAGECCSCNRIRRKVAVH